MYRPPYPAESYLLRTEKRYRWRDAAGRVDRDALAITAKLLPTAPELAGPQRDRLCRVVDRVQKAAWNVAALAAAGLLDERFGFPVVVEVPDGGIRRGVSDDGTVWETVFTGGSYGFLPDTVARDAEEIDFVGGPNALAENVYIVAFMTLDSDGMGAKLDEYKLFGGFDSYEAAEACALANWPRERIGPILTMPVEVLRGLLGFELDEGIVQKALGLAAGGGLVVTAPSGVVIGRVEKCLPKAALAPVQKSAISTATFAGGGLMLPTQGKPRMMRGKLHDDIAAKADRCAKALASACAYEPGQFSTGPIEHPACTWPLTTEYEEPDAVGWLGTIEPDDETWIAFVDGTGHTLLWQEREADGGVRGTPIALARLDIATAKALPDRYKDIDFSPPEGVREAARRGIALHEEGKSGDGLEPATVAWARRIAAGEKISPEKARQGARWFGRNRRFKDEPKDSPAWTSYQLWFGDAGDAWMSKLVEQMDARDRNAGVDKSVACTAKTLDVDVLDASDERIAKTIATVKLCPVSKGLDASTPIDRRIVYGVVLEPEPFGGRGDGHDETYAADVIRRAAYNWLGSFANFDDSHGRFLSKQEIIVVESFIAPVQFTISGTVVAQGSWVVAAKIVSDVLWGRVLSGELSAWSIEGYATRNCTTCDARMKAKKRADGEREWLCPNCDRLALLLP